MEGVPVTVNTYLATSKEFQPIVVEKTVNGTTTKVLTGVQYVVVPKGTKLETGTLQNVDTLDGDIGFYTDQLTPGYWEVGARVVSTPETPLVSCGFIRIK
jgi:hypothetical protein